MKAVMPIARNFPEAQRAFRWACEVAGIHDWRMVWLKDDYEYARLMIEFWLAGESFIIVEHDIVVDPAHLLSLRECPEPWCGFPYLQARGEPVMGLGLTKFGRLAIAAVPDMPALLYGEPWQNVDARMAAPRLAGLEQHKHLPPVMHLKEIE